VNFNFPNLVSIGFLLLEDPKFSQIIVHQHLPREGSFDRKKKKNVKKETKI